MNSKATPPERIRHHATVARLDYPGRVSFGENLQDEEVAPSTTLPTKIAAFQGVAAIGSNRCWPGLSPSTTSLTPAHHPKAAKHCEHCHERSSLPHLQNTSRRTPRVQVGGGGVTKNTPHAWRSPSCPRTRGPAPATVPGRRTANAAPASPGEEHRDLQPRPRGGRHNPRPRGEERRRAHAKLGRSHLGC